MAAFCSSRHSHLGMSRPSMDAEADFATSTWDRQQVLQSLQNRTDENVPHAIEVIVEPGDVCTCQPDGDTTSRTSP